VATPGSFWRLRCETYPAIAQERLVSTAVLGNVLGPAASASPTHHQVGELTALRDVGGSHHERHPADRLDDLRLTLQRLPGKEK
jgi:hypothetical protein